MLIIEDKGNNQKGKMELLHQKASRECNVLKIGT